MISHNPLTGGVLEPAAAVEPSASTEGRGAALMAASQPLSDDVRSSFHAVENT